MSYDAECHVHNVRAAEPNTTSELQWLTTAKLCRSARYAVNAATLLATVTSAACMNAEKSRARILSPPHLASAVVRPLH